MEITAPNESATLSGRACGRLVNTELGRRIGIGRSITRSCRTCMLSIHPDYVNYYLLTPVAVDRTIVESEWMFHPGNEGDPAFNPADAIAVLGRHQSSGLGHRRAEPARNLVASVSARSLLAAREHSGGVGSRVLGDVVILKERSTDYCAWGRAMWRRWSSSLPCGKEEAVSTNRAFGVGALIAVAAAVLIGARLPSPTTLQVGENDIGGVVTGPKGPEAGVWVIAETSELPTKFVRIVVTDDQGDTCIPDLPKANYNVWVRGYGLVDSPKSQSARRQNTQPHRGAAPNPRAAGAYYPAGSLVVAAQGAGQERIPGHWAERQRHLAEHQIQADSSAPSSRATCTACHQLGTKGTREIPAASLGVPVELRRVGATRAVRPGRDADAGTRSTSSAISARSKMFADWTDRIAAGEVPPAPRRPQGIERNVVITEWDWADPKSYLHDVVSTDRRNPTLNANGLMYGSLELSSDYLPVLDPVHNTVSRVPLTVRDPNTQPATGPPTGAPSAYWGEEASGRARTTCTIRCSTSRDASGSRRAFVRRIIRRSARRVRRIRRPSSSR